MEKIVILHTNDLHSHLENWPRIRSYLQTKKKQYECEGTTVIMVDLGDFVDRWHPLTEATGGKANILLMNEVSYNAVTFGNNEGIGLSKQQLNTLYQEANFDVIVGNLQDLVTKRSPLWLKSYKIIQTINHTKIGLIALTAPFPLTYEPNGWTVASVSQVLPQLLEEVRPKCDILVLLSHLGIQADKEIALNYPEINLILGSHTHHLFETGKKINEVPLSAAGKFGRYIGEVRLSVCDKHLKKTKIKAICTADLEVMMQDSLEIQQYILDGQQQLQKKIIANIPFPLDFPSFYSLALDACKERAGVTASILNSGLFLRDIPKGEINAEQLHQALPHPMHLIKVTLSGEHLIHMLQEMNKNQPYLKNFPITGMGFRGKRFGELCYSGISYDPKTKQGFWQNKKINIMQEYTFVTVDHLLFIPFFPSIEIDGQIEFIFPDMLRQVVGDYLHSYYPSE